MPSRTRSWESGSRRRCRSTAWRRLETARLQAIRPGSQQTEASLPLGEKLRRRASMIYRSKGERHQIAGYYEADFTIDLEPGVGAAGPRTSIGGARDGGPLKLGSRGRAR